MLCKRVGAYSSGALIRAWALIRGNTVYIICKAKDVTVGKISWFNPNLIPLHQVIFKCCKRIPVMIGGILIQGIKM